jgi:hypothetical protein
VRCGAGSAGLLTTACAAPDWTSECYQCRGREAVATWTRRPPPRPGVEVVELEDGVGDERGKKTKKLRGGRVRADFHAAAGVAPRTERKRGGYAPIWALAPEHAGGRSRSGSSC